MLFKRESGVLLHPSSLPGPYGIGEIGPAVEIWLDFLQETGQSLWQVLPLGPTGYGDSPYQAHSTFAGNPMLISFEDLHERGLVRRCELDSLPAFPERTVQFAALIAEKRRLLQVVARSFFERADETLLASYRAYCLQQSAWLNDFAIFTAIKAAHDQCAWVTWPVPLRDRDPDAISAISNELADEIEAVRIEQFLFKIQWELVRTAARRRSIRIIGDIPIFVAHDSADVWVRRDLFLLDPSGNPTVVAGVPPDYFSSTGQRWGNPLYDWERHEQERFDWWINRIENALTQADIVRIDHFRGFESYWEIPATDETAENGRWVRAPGQELFSALMERFGSLPIIAEDLGFITAAVRALRDQFSLPGTKILQFAFGDDDQKDSFLPKNYPENCVAYTGTHDNDTIVGWMQSTSGIGSVRSAKEIQAEKERARAYLESDGSEIHWDFITALQRSKAGAVIVPLQDILGLGSEARMNTPSTLGGNWSWRFEWAQLSSDIRQRLRKVVAASRRRSCVDLS